VGSIIPESDRGGIYVRFFERRVQKTSATGPGVLEGNDRPVAELISFLAAQAKDLDHPYFSWLR
jgi:hypothetical protein